MTQPDLTQFIESIDGDNHLRVQDDLGDGFVRLRAAEAQRRQAKQDIRCTEDIVIEMLRNARDAHASLYFLATWKEQDKRSLTFIDNGDGVPENLHETIFEPFVTSKLDSFHADKWGVHGRGMALYSIRENAESARILKSSPGRGSIFTVQTDTTHLGEKKDQSSQPQITFNDAHKPVLRGPHNIIRTVLEFAIEQRDRGVVFLGSPSEIASTLYYFPQSSALTFSPFSDEETLPYMYGLALSEDPTDFSNRAQAMGLPLSSRNARRIMNGEIAPLAPHIEILAQEPADTDSPLTTTLKELKRSVQERKQRVHFEQEDLEAFKHEVAKAYDDLAQKYYLGADEEPSIRVGKKALTITIPFTF